MSESSSIEWCDSTFNPWIGCARISPACDHCYAAASTPARTLGIKWGTGQPRRRTVPSNWAQPRRWNAQRFAQCTDCGWRGERPKTAAGDRGECPACADGMLGEARRRVFCASLADVFDNEVPAQWRTDLFALIRATPNLDWLLLTKRIGNVDRMIAESVGALPRDDRSGTGQHNHTPMAEWPWPNVWLGATICNQAEAERDIPKLLRVPAAVRFLSIEPMLGSVKLRWEWVSRGRPLGGGPMCNLREPWKVPEPDPAVDWVIAGGESGTHARPMHPDWVRSLRDQCAAAGVPFLFKQWGEWKPRDEWSDLHLRTKPRRFETMTAIMLDGSACPHEAVPQDVGAHRMARVGKKAAGRLLDGIEHNGYPKGMRHG